MCINATKPQFERASRVQRKLLLRACEKLPVSMKAIEDAATAVDLFKKIASETKAAATTG